MKLILLVTLTLFISSCKPIEQKASEEFLNKTVNQSWVNKVPYDDLFKAHIICSKHPDFEGCGLVDNQIYDISVSYTSCLYDQKSKLCKMILNEIRNTSIYLALPKTNALLLPSSPFYWSLPTKLLEAQSSHYGYRDETKSWLWKEIKFAIYATALSALIAFNYFCFNFYRKKIQQNIEKQHAIQTALKYELQDNEFARLLNEHNQKQAKLEQERRILDAEKKAKDEREKLIAEQQKILLEAKIAQEKQQKINQERAEINKVLKEIFKGKN